METVEVEYHERGCGDPAQGGAYFKIGLSSGGIPLQSFARDPIIPIDRDKFQIKDRGMSLVQIGDTYHVFDLIGSTHYPNVMDWWNELRHFGLHVRVESNLDFSKLDKTQSLYIPVHDHAYITNDKDVRDLMAERRKLPGHTYCSKSIEDHDKWWSGEFGNLTAEQPPRCWETLHHNIISGVKTADCGEGQVERQMPEFAYIDYQQFKARLKHQTGAFAAFPISMIELLVYDGDGFENTVENIKKNGGDEVFNMYKAVLVEEFTDYENAVELDVNYVE